METDAILDAAERARLAAEAAESAAEQARRAADMAAEQASLLADLSGAAAHAASGGAIDPFVFRLSIFVLAIFVGYYVVWSVTPALHTPLLSVTNAISSIIIVGALIAVGPVELHASKVLGFIAVTLAAVNIFGGFTVTQRMLQMFRKKDGAGGARR